MTFILSQVCVIIGMILLGLSYLVKNKTKVLVLCIISSIMYGVQYLLLRAFTGTIVNVIGIIRTIWFYENNRKNKENSIFSVLLISALFILSAIFTWDGFVSLLPLFSCLVFTYSIWSESVYVYKWLAIPVSVSWITYNAFVGSFFGYIMEIILLSIEIIGLILMYKKNKVNKGQDLLI